MRHVLRPGIHALRRDERWLQVGLDPERAVVLPDDAAAQTCLRLLREAAPEEAYDAEAARLRDTLAACGLLVDSAAVTPLLAGPTTPVASTRRTPARFEPGAVAALAGEVGDAVGTMLRASDSCRVAITGFGPDDRPATQLQELVTAAGVPTTGPGRPPRRTGRAPAVRALVGVGEPERELVDPWLGAGTPYLVVRFVEGTATVGPFVVPGQTACLRCIDAHRTDADPSWPLLVVQHAAETARARPDGIPEPVDPLLVALAVAWAARDLVTFAEGGRPATWSATTRFGARLGTVETESWLRHPGCGCSWD